MGLSTDITYTTLGLHTRWTFTTARSSGVSPSESSSSEALTETTVDGTWSPLVDDDEEEADNNLPLSMPPGPACANATRRRGRAVQRKASATCDRSMKKSGATVIVAQNTGKEG